MDKIYSRRRIKLPTKKKRKLRKISKFRFFLFCIILILVIGIVCFLVASYPIFVASCKTAASSKAIHIVSEEVENIMQDYTYNELMDVEKDESGNVTLIKSNTILINQVVSKIVKRIQERIDGAPTTMVYINYGSVSGISVLKNFGPKFEIELESAGGIDTNVKSEFISVGVNQTLNRIYLEVNTAINILTPIGSYGKEVDSKVLLTEAVIVGNVPETYYNLEGMSKDDLLNVLE